MYFITSMKKNNVKHWGKKQCVANRITAISKIGICLTFQVLSLSFSFFSFAFPLINRNQINVNESRKLTSIFTKWVEQ